MQRQIAHLDLDSFFVSVERLRNRAYLSKPLIIGGTSNRGIISSCSYEARAYGLRSAMPIKQAKLLCPENVGIYITPDMDEYSKHSKIVTQIIEEKSPLYEKSSIDEHYIDLTGMDKFFNCLKWSQELRQTIIKESGLPISFGLSVNKTVSKIATDQGKPNGELYVPQDRVIPFLSPLHVNKMPMVGEKTNEQLKQLGITTIKGLRQVPIQLLQKIFGKSGVSLWEKAHGIDTSPVEPYSERKSISSEITFNKDTIDIKMLDEVIAGMLEEVCFQLRKEEKVSGCVVIKLRYSNFDTHTIRQKISYTAFDHEIISVAKQLFKKLYEKRMLIRLIGVKLTELCQGNQQINLFDNTTEQISLYQTLDKIKKRFGDNSVMHCPGLLMHQKENPKLNKQKV
ncbi:MAG: DNA polymerase IV [Bacteroidota bacterium]